MRLHRHAEQALEVPADGLVGCDAAREDHGSPRRFAGEKRVGHVAGEAGAQSVADLLERMPGLLGMNEVRAGEHRAPGRDPRGIAGVRERRFCQLPTRREGEPPGLLIEKTAGAGSAGGIGSGAHVPAGLVEADQGKALAADREDRPDGGKEPPAGHHEGHEWVDGPGNGDQARSRTRDPDPRHPARREIGHRSRESLPHLPRCARWPEATTTPDASSRAHETETEPMSRPSTGSASMVGSKVLELPLRDQPGAAISADWR